MNKAAELQNQVKQNNVDLTDFLKDLTRWEEKVKNDDKNLKSERSLEEKLPPVRSKVKNVKDGGSTANPGKVTEEKAARINSYDYDAWSKFDVDKACEKVDMEVGGEEEDETGEESEDENNEELDKLRIQQAVQKSVMEKEKGNQLFKDGKYDAAINRYTSAISLNPRNPILYANRGMALMKKEQYAAAEQDCDVALQLDPSYSKAIARRGVARKKMKKYDEALEDFNLLLKVEPKNQQALTEIKDLNGLMKKSKSMREKNELKSVTNSVPQSQVDGNKFDDNARTENRSRRSKKPLKRIQITEVGIDEPKKLANEKTKKRIAPDSASTSSAGKSMELVQPKSSFMFETEFKKLKNNVEQFYAYVKLIPLADYNKLFYQSIDNIISPFLTILKECYMRDEIPYHDEMIALSRVSRFDMATMFLSRGDKENVHQLISNMASDSYGHTLENGMLEEISSKYKSKI